MFTIACFVSYINNRQQTAAHNVVLDKLNGIEGSLCKILKWFKPNNKHCSPKPTKSKIYRKVKSEIEDLGQGSIGTSTAKNFYKWKTNSKLNTLRLIVLWVENER